jgi:ribosome-associated protein
LAKKKTDNISAEIKARRIAQVADEAKATDIVILDVRGLSNVADFFVIFTGTSQTHLRAIGKRLEEHLEPEGICAERIDGFRATNWIVFDFGSVIAHAMLEEARQFYDLERLWGDAPRLSWQ